MESEYSPIFITRYLINREKIYNKDSYLTIIMRNSIFERLITKYIFQQTSKEFNLNPFLINIQKNNVELEKFKENLNLLIKYFKEENPLQIFSEISEEILNLLKESNLNDINFDKYLLNIEFLLSSHFENNFYEKQIENKMNENFFDLMYLQKGITNFNYSIESLTTICKFLKVFEIQNLSTRIENEFPLIKNLFCTEKIYYFYCDKLEREKNNSGNLVQYLISNLISKFEILKNSKVNNIQIENYILINLFFINKIIQNYSFYFHKQPELLNIFHSLKIFKNFPIPISNFTNNILENIINEISFQGITILNKIREVFFIDFLDKNVKNFETKYFNSAILVYDFEWEKKHFNNENIENFEVFNIIKFINRICKKEKNNKYNNFNLREFMMKIFNTILFNSNKNFSDENFQKIFLNFYPNYKNNNNNNFEEENSNIKNSLDKILKIIDVGFDKNINDFMNEINIIAEKLINLDIKNFEFNENENILETKDFLPITNFRNYLKPNYNLIKKIYKISENNINENFNLDIFDLYIKNFQFIIMNYFPYLINENEDELIEKNLENLRENFYINYKINIVLFEQNGTFNNFIENLDKNIFNNNDKISNEDFDSFWKYFVKNKKEVKPKFLLHIVPIYENCNQNPFKFLTEKDKYENCINYLSEFIASNDFIYKNIVFIPFASNCDKNFINFIPNCQNISNDIMEFPTLDCMYSFLKKPLDYYISDSNGIFNLDLYEINIEISIENKKKEKITKNSRKIFWKNLEFLCLENNNIYQGNIKLIMFCVDCLGLEFHEKKIILELNEKFNIKIFNLFFKKNVPFNYNNPSNNGWLEVFLNDKFIKEEVDKICNYSSFIKNNIEGKYYEEFNVPQMDLETFFKNFKVKKLILEFNEKTDFDVSLKIDDLYDFDFKSLIPKIKKGEKLNVVFNVNACYVDNNNNFNKNNNNDDEFDDSEMEKISIPIATFQTI